ncbi:MAG: hypothetical protein DWI01_07065 [Planctomycetota bacterium]|nr:MAG: hypothetical protein DWI01_07065 [Planctomycetota bacterium]
MSLRPFAWLFLSSLISIAAAAEPAKMETIDAQPSWILESPQVRLAVTKVGGQMAPVTFLRDSGKPVQPYHVSPWQNEGLKDLPAPVLTALRGDWFCLPFGGNGDAFRHEKHPPHGEVAGAEWTYVDTKHDGGRHTLVLAFEPQARKGKIVKELSLVEGHNAVYSRHIVTGFSGPAPCGHHATLAMPDEPGVFRVSTSPIEFGMTNPSRFSDPAKREYQALAIAAPFTDLAHVPLLEKGTGDADLTRLPARQGYADLVQVVNKQDATAWTCATRTDEGWLWYALKDPKVLRSTLFWIENRGRHGSPWNGRNNCLGLEDVTSFFADGLAASAGANLLTRRGVPTAIEFTADKPTEIRYIQGVTRVPEGFGKVVAAEYAPGSVTFVAEGGERVTVPVRHEFLSGAAL